MRPEFRVWRRATFTLLNGDTAAGRPALSAFFHGAHPAFGLRANAEAYTADDNTDTRRRGPFLNDPASLRSRFLNEGEARKTRRNDEICQSGSGQNYSHGKSSFIVVSYSSIRPTSLSSECCGHIGTAGRPHLSLQRLRRELVR